MCTGEAGAYTAVQVAAAASVAAGRSGSSRRSGDSSSGGCKGYVTGREAYVLPAGGRRTTAGRRAAYYCSRTPTREAPGLLNSRVGRYGWAAWPAMMHDPSETVGSDWGIDCA